LSRGIAIRTFDCAKCHWRAAAQFCIVVQIERRTERCLTIGVTKGLAVDAVDIDAIGRLNREGDTFGVCWGREVSVMEWKKKDGKTYLVT
jgi:hypothetical protein